MQHTSRFLTIAETARQGVTEISIDNVKTKLDQQHSFFLVDVREESEWMQGHLPQAIHLGKGVIERDIEKIISDPNADIVLYCGGGYRSALAASNIQKMGYTHVRSLAGGIKAWMQAGGLIKRSCKN